MDRPESDNFEMNLPPQVDTDLENVESGYVKEPGMYELFSDYFLSRYVCAYYISLDDCVCLPYKQGCELDKRFPIVNDYFRSLCVYIEADVHPDDRAMLQDTVNPASLKERLLLESIITVVFRDISYDREKTYELQIIRGGDENHAALGFADISDRIKARNEQREKEERDRAVVGALSDDFGSVVYVDYDTFSEVHYRLDPLFEEHIPGWTEMDKFDERLRKLVELLVHPDDKKAFTHDTSPSVVQKALETEKYYTVNFRILIDEEIMYYQCKFVRDEHCGNHVIAGFHNVDSETKRELAALEKAEKANRAKTDFLFNMSHDIRTPMNAIIGFTNMAMRDIDDKEKVEESLSKVQSASEILLSILNDILDMSRIESGKVAINTVAADMNKAFADIDPIMSELARAKNIDLMFSVRQIDNRYAYVDTQRTERILVNLISNAIKFTLEGGWVNVSLRQLTEEEDGIAVYRFVIADNGIGMSREFKKRCFDEFAREETSTVSGIQGTGMGLSLARALTELMNGNIYCESERGVGSVFTVDIPYYVLQESDLTANKKKKSKKEVSLAGKRGLLVEDNELNREIAADILHEEGIIVTEAEDGRVAIDKLSSMGPDCFDFVLMDIQMPFMNGYEAARHIRKNFPNRDLPIIALSANAFEEDRRKSVEAGMDAHIAKPVKPGELIEVLRKYV